MEILDDVFEFVIYLLLCIGVPIVLMAIIIGMAIGGY